MWMEPADSEACPICGHGTEAVQCRLICRNCGYTEDCSDLFPADPPACRRRQTRTTAASVMNTGGSRRDVGTSGTQAVSGTQRTVIIIDAPAVPPADDEFDYPLN
ncbi:MAG: hypothetical protein JXA69_03620 [Phycisphaerae bacterium]|nr:hypothetical protein [Phycisphaerae bacterium]